MGDTSEVVIFAPDNNGIWGVTVEGQEKSRLIAGDELIIYSKVAGNTLLCFVVSGEVSDAVAIDKVTINRVARRLETLQRLVNKHRESDR